MIRFLYLVVLLAAFCILHSEPLSATATLSSSPKRVAAEIKLNQLRELSNRERGHIINLDDSSYTYYAINKPRPYTLIVFLTAEHPKFRCAICKQTESDVRQLAAAYHSDLKAKGEQPSIFFVKVDYERAPLVFQGYELSTVPYILHVPPYQGERTGGDYDLNPRDKYQVAPEPRFEAVLQFFRDRTGVHIEIKSSSFWAYISILTLFSVLALCVEPIINALPLVQAILQSKSLWVAISIGIYTCAISGLIFDIIRSPQIYHSDGQSGHITFFYPQSGHQFVIEGFIIGFLNLAGAGALIFAAAIAPNMRTAKEKSTAITAAFLFFLICFFTVRNLYQMKNRWYLG
jgi:hypothetical protein